MFPNAQSKRFLFGVGVMAGYLIQDIKKFIVIHCSLNEYQPTNFVSYLLHHLHSVSIVA